MTKPEDGRLPYSGRFLAETLPAAYRFAVLALGESPEASGVVREAMAATWRLHGGTSAATLNRAFRRRLEDGCARELKRLPAGPESSDGQLAGALRGLSPHDRLALIREFGPDAESARGLGRKLRGAPIERLRRFLGASGATADAATEPETTAEGATARLAGRSLEDRLTAYYAALDPGDQAPLGLRLELLGVLTDLDAKRLARERAAWTGRWGFAINTILAIVAGTVAISLVSVSALRAGEQPPASPVRGPAVPLTLATTTILQSDIRGSAIHVAATRDHLVAAFQGPAVWHPSARECVPDTVGTIDASGTASWLGPAAGHLDTIAGSPGSDVAYAAGLGAYCDPGSRVSSDGGTTWTNGSSPPAGAGRPSWLAFDPAHPDTLVAAGDGVLSVSRDAGATWTDGRQTVAPVAFESSGRLFGWAPGGLFESLDDGSSWSQIGNGPAAAPNGGAAVPGGLLLARPDGLWMYSVTPMPGMDGASTIDGAPTLVHAGAAYAVAPAGDGALAAGSDAAGHPWLGTYSANSSEMPFREFALPPAVAVLRVTGGEVAANPDGAVVGLTGEASILLFATFAH